MSGFDIFALAVLVASLLWGYKRGLVVQMGSLLAFAVALAACRIFGSAATDAVTAMMGGNEVVNDPAQSSMTHFMASCIGHVTLFIIVWVGVWFLARTVKFVAKALHLGLLDGLGGALFMALKSGLIMSFFINFARFIAPNSALASSDSTIADAIGDLAPTLLGFIQPLT